MARPVLRLNDGLNDTSPNLRDDVRQLQTLLNQQGFTVNVDRVFGPATEDAVKSFQRQHNLADDGVVGPLTWAALLGTAPPDAGKIFPTTFTPNDPALIPQLEASTQYKPFIDEAATKFGLEATVIGGIGSRESHWGLVLKPPGPAGTGDLVGRRRLTRFRTGPLPPDGKGFGRGLLQIDYDAHEFARTGNWQDPRENILYGGQVLADSRDFMRQNTNLDDTPLLRAALAAYNAGSGRVLKAIQGGLDADSVTTGGNYATDVLNRAGWFQLKGWS